MIHKKLEDILIGDINYLVENNIQERKTLEYKSVLPNNSDGDKKEFLADISSLANTEGGDLIYGIKEVAGILQKDIGFVTQNIDADIARLHNLIRDGISPRIIVEIKTLDCVDGRKIFILRTKASVEFPHRVIFGAHDKFYRRNTNGKYAMDVGELRGAFNRSGELSERIKSFRSQRIFDIKSGETPKQLNDASSFFAIHIIPMSAFSTSFSIGSEKLLSLRNAQHANSFCPLYASGWSYRINLDGVVAYSHSGETIRNYTQLYRDGRIEAIETTILNKRTDQEKMFLPMAALENMIMQYTEKMLGLLSGFEFQPPFYIYLSFIGVKGFTVLEPPSRILDQEPITQDDLFLPEIIIESFSDNLHHKFRPIFDMIWNAAGISRSLDFDEEGNFVPV